MKIIIIEDDHKIASNIKTILEHHNYVVEIEETGKSGFDKALFNEYDLIILDWMLPDSDGPTICKKLRKEKIKTPILMLTARTQVEDKVLGLNTGADDYLGKPFAMDELLARVKALLRRNYIDTRSPILAIDNLELDSNSCKVFRDKKEILLAPKEYALLEFLMKNPGKALDRMTILNHVWDENTDLFTNTVDVHIRYLRKKIDSGKNKKLIQTVKGVGYMICQS